MDLLARVEGEGRFTLIVEDGVVREARLAIFEAPRYFEAFLRHRSVLDVPDMVARVCGICPVAYQMSAVNALERGVTPEIRSLRRLMYCGEWIQSHALHVFVLHAPDFLGYRSVIEMAADHRAVVERGLRLRRAGDRIVEVLGGRAIHPVSVRVGGFTAVPPELGALRAELAPALGEAIDATRWAAGLPCPAFEQDYVFVALGGEVYPLEGGDVVWVSGRAPVPLGDWASAFVERQVPYSTALQCHLADGTPYLCGPLARWHHHRDRIHPTARSLAEELAIDEVRNPYRSIVVPRDRARPGRGPRPVRRLRADGPVRGDAAAGGRGLRRIRGAARALVAPVRRPRRRHGRGRADRAAHVAEPGQDRSGSG